MSSGEMDASCEMLCLDLCMLLGCGYGLGLEVARRVLFNCRAWESLAVIQAASAPGWWVT